jgi:endonuclease/exonuclease/phosphatase family metal-dependent hydrolase
VTVELPDGRPLRFISTHFQHNLAEDRLAQANRINQLFAAEGDQVLTILAGDLNALPESEPMKVIHQRWTNTMNSPPVASAPSTDPHSRIDYILYRPAGSLKLLESAVLDEPTASDHFPVFAVFKLPAKPPAGDP